MKAKNPTGTKYFRSKWRCLVMLGGCTGLWFGDWGFVGIII